MNSWNASLHCTKDVLPLSRAGLIYLHFLLKCRPYGREVDPETDYTGELPPFDERHYIQGLLLQARAQYTTYTNLMDQILNVFVLESKK
jgi:hypothetical protein